MDVQEYIRQGDVFQVNLSLRQEAQLKSSPEDVYEWLRKLNPVPVHGALAVARLRAVQRFTGAARQAARGQSERPAHRRHPAPGTHSRGGCRHGGGASRERKEIAEHIMLVDLERNDIGRVAAYGSVSVPELMTVERYSHVMHLVSQVEGQIAPDKDAYAVIAALFPGEPSRGLPR